MGVVDFAEYVNSAIQAGSAVEGTAVKIIADNGNEIGEAVYKVIQGGNGEASEIAVATQTGAGGAIATGLAYLSLDIGVAGAAIAPALGILAGVGLYNLAPEFWTNVSERLVNAGKTIGGKIIAFWNGNNVYFDEETIEIFKAELVAISAFEEEDESTSDAFPDISILNNTFRFTKCIPDARGVMTLSYLDENGTPQTNPTMWVYDWSHLTTFTNSDIYPQNWYLNYLLTSKTRPTDSRIEHIYEYTYDDKTVYFYNFSGDGYQHVSQYTFPINPNSLIGALSYSRELAWIIEYGEHNGSGIELEPGATYPDTNPFPQTYPDWYPLEYPQTLPDPGELPVVYPLKYPGVGPDGYPDQDPAQNPDPENVPDIYPVITPDFDIPDPGIPTPPEPEPDPDPQPEPDPIPEEPEPNPDPDPVDPNPEPDPSVPIVIPPFPDTVNSSKLFTVYNPTSSQLDALGGYLWDASIIAAIRDIWQEPMDGLISLQQVFVTPSTSGNHNIILGFLDSGVSAAVVSNQFVTVDCGTVSVKEDKKNATDYAPYTSIHLYLPFIGIVELDTNECMNADISVKYKVDVYTGTCLAQVSVDRDADMPNDPILYTFSGNCSQQLPLTSGNSTGVLSALLAGVSAGVSVASGGGLSTVAGYHLAGSSLTHEMMHVSHSGNISANAGIMGQKKPYLIIGRRHGYDANDYNSFYGYPANKTVVMGNHSGYVKVKKCWIKTSATSQEYDEIIRILEEDGAFL